MLFPPFEMVLRHARGKTGRQVNRPNSDHTVLSPTAISLVTGTVAHLETRAIAFLGLDFSDEVGLLQTSGLDAQLLRLILHFRHIHGQYLFLPPIDGQGSPRSQCS